MRNVCGSSGFALLCGIVLCSAAVVDAQDLRVAPTAWDFGEVAVGTSETVTFDLESLGPTAVWTYLTGFTETPTLPPSGEPFASPHYGIWSLGPFSFNPLTYPFLPLEMPKDLHVLVDVTFTPPAPGDYSAWLLVWSNDSVPPPDREAFFPLEGTGVVPAVPLPGAALLGVIGLSCVGGCLRKLRAA